MRQATAVIRLSEEEVKILQDWSRRGKSEHRLVERARIILLAGEGRTNEQIAKALKTRTARVSKWRQRFGMKRLAGLGDAERSGKPAKYDDHTEKRGLGLLDEAPPKGYSQWNGRLVAEALPAISKDQVWRILRRHDICLERRRRWCVSSEPEVCPKAADIIGLYLNPPENALVLSVDEKPSIQALERATGYVQTSSGKIVQGLKSTYKRHGTVNLFAALEVATGVIRGKTTQTKKRVDFQAFMTDLIAEQPPDREIHVILDNLSTHKKNDDWLAAHPNVTFHFTPT